MLPGISLFPEQASTLAADVDQLYFFITAVTAFFALVVTIFVIYFAAKYRDERSDGGRRAASPGRSRSSWRGRSFRSSSASSSSSGAPASSSTSTARPTRRSRSTPQANAGCGSSSTSTARSEINELHVPMGRPVKITFTSEDVLHSMFFPAFRVKADAIPGRYSTSGSRRRSSGSSICSARNTAAPSIPAWWAACS